MLISWKTNAEDQRFQSTQPGGEILGWAGSDSAKAGEGFPHTYVTGQLTLNGPAIQTMLNNGRTSDARAVVEHELGHVLGLAHVEDPEQLMFTHQTGKVSTYQAGDLAGLSLLGQGVCQPGL